MPFVSLEDLPCHVKKTAAISMFMIRGRKLLITTNTINCCIVAAGGFVPSVICRMVLELQKTREDVNRPQVTCLNIKTCYFGNFKRGTTIWKTVFTSSCLNSWCLHWKQLLMWCGIRTIASAPTWPVKSENSSDFQMLNHWLRASLVTCV